MGNWIESVLIINVKEGSHFLFLDDLGHSFPTVSWAALGFLGPSSGAALMERWGHVSVPCPHLNPSNFFWWLYLIY